MIKSCNKFCKLYIQLLLKIVFENNSRYFALSTFIDVWSSSCWIVDYYLSLHSPVPTPLRYWIFRGNSYWPLATENWDWLILVNYEYQIVSELFGFWFLNRRQDYIVHTPHSTRSKIIELLWFLILLFIISPDIKPKDNFPLPISWL